jgi:hypothetical protein
MLRDGAAGMQLAAPELRILMGQDLRDEHLIGFGVSRTIGDEQGFAVELDIQTPQGRQQVSFWTTEDVGNRLGAFLTDPPATPDHSELGGTVH